MNTIKMLNWLVMLDRNEIRYGIDEMRNEKEMKARFRFVCNFLQNAFVYQILAFC